MKEIKETRKFLALFCLRNNTHKSLEGSALKLPEFIALVFQGNESLKRKNEVVTLRSLAKPHRPLRLLSSIALSCRASKSQTIATGTAGCARRQGCLPKAKY